LSKKSKVFSVFTSCGEKCCFLIEKASLVTKQEKIVEVIFDGREQSFAFKTADEADMMYEAIRELMKEVHD
jgi:hypothetical protein